jgi:hypothetical protein
MRSMAATIEERDMAKATPLNRVKDEYGDKSKLVDKIAALVEPKGDESSDAHKRRLKNVSNKKLLHLLALGEKVKALGGRDAIVKRILELRGQSKDHEYGDKLKRLPLGRVVDLVSGLERGARDRTAPKAAKAPAAKKAAKAPVAKKATKAPAAKKSAAKKGAAKPAKANTRARATAR